MLARVFSGTTIGLDGVLIEVEVDIANRGFPTFKTVGTQHQLLSSRL